MTSVASLEEEFFAGKSIAGGDPNFWKRSSHFPPAVLLPKKGIPNKFHAQTAQANEPSTVAVAKGTLLFLSMLVVIVWLFSLLLLRDCFFLAASCASNSALRTGLKLCFWKADSAADSLATRSRSRSELGAKFSAETAA